jgi:hypothetical protein
MSHNHVWILTHDTYFRVTQGAHVCVLTILNLFNSMKVLFKSDAYTNHVRIHICRCAYITVCRGTYMCTYTHPYTRVYMCTYLYACEQARTQAYTHTYIQKYRYMHEYIHSYTHACVIAHAYMHAYIHTHIHTYIKMVHIHIFRKLVFL